jgi:hypothetical protein
VWLCRCTTAKRAPGTLAGRSIGIGLALPWPQAVQWTCTYKQSVRALGEDLYASLVLIGGPDLLGLVALYIPAHRQCLQGYVVRTQGVCLLFAGHARPVWYSALVLHAASLQLVLLHAWMSVA